MKKAVIFDMDGVIVNTGPIGLEVMQQTVAPHITSPLTEAEIEHYIGAPDREFFAALVEDRGLSVQAATLLATQVKNYEAALEKDVHENAAMCELIRAIAPTHKLAVYSGSTTHQINFILHTLGLTDLFACKISCDDVTYGKPHPEGFLTALDCLDMSAADTIVIEDSPVGVTGSLAAGIDVIQYSNGPASKSTDATFHVTTVADIKQYL